MSSEMMAWAFWQRPKSAGGKLLLISLSDGHLIYDKNNREASCPVATLCDFCCLPSPSSSTSVNARICLFIRLHPYLS